MHTQQISRNDINGRNVLCLNAGCELGKIARRNTHKLKYSHNTARLLENSQIVLHGWSFAKRQHTHTSQAHALFPTFLSMIAVAFGGKNTAYVRLIVVFNLGQLKMHQKNSRIDLDESKKSKSTNKMYSSLLKNVLAHIELCLMSFR